MAKENRVVAYATPLNYKNVQETAKKEQISQSKIVNRALYHYFKTKPTK